MRGRGDGGADAAGGLTRHRPVLLAEVCDVLHAERGGVLVDGTFGAGGYTRALLDHHPDTRVIAIDRDPDAIAAGAPLVAAACGRLTLVPGRFSHLDRIVAEAGHEGVDGVVLDIGVSSMQLDEAERGFSFRYDGPLDMRMERAGPSAADLVNEASEATLADIFFYYGEERRARAVARAVIERRRKERIETTAQLAGLVAELIRPDPSGIHPATRVFQALRIAVNDELGELSQALHAAERALRPGGRLAVVTFHSLEDRIVKHFMAARSGRVVGASRHRPAAQVAEPTFAPITKGPVAPGAAEVAANPRARSAKLRAAERTKVPAQDVLASLKGLVELPRGGEGRGRR